MTTNTCRGEPRLSEPRLSEPRHTTIPPGARDFLATRGSFYFATLSDAGWYRAIGDLSSGVTSEIHGPAGFLRFVDDSTVGWADLNSDLRHIPSGHMDADGGTALFAVDYPNQQHLMIFGHARIIQFGDEPELQATLCGDERSGVERGAIVTIDALDWNFQGDAVRSRRWTRGRDDG
jgi:hypothetical protein